MATITGDSVVTTLGVVHVYTLTGADIDTDKAIVWSGDNCFDLRVGEYIKKFVNGTDASEGYYFDHKEYIGTGVNARPVIDPKKASMIVDEDDHTEPGTFRLFASFTKTADGLGGEVIFEGQVGIHHAAAKPDPTFTRHSITPTYVTHIYDSPQIESITVKFATTYPTDTREYEHHIHLNGSSQHYWDDGDRLEDNALTPTDGIISRNIDVNHFRPHGQYNGYTTVSATGQVFLAATEQEPAKLVAASGYMIYIEYDHGQAHSIRYLFANGTDALVDAECNKIIARLPD